MNEALLPELEEENDDNNIINTDINKKHSLTKHERNKEVFNELDINFSESKNKYNSIIIPYDFHNKKYTVPEKDIEFFEGKENILNTLSEFNSKKIFKLDSPYSPSFFKSSLILIPMILIMLLTIYILLLITIYFIFNPLLIYASFKIIYYLYNFLKSIKNILYEKDKKKVLNKELEEKNKSEYYLNKKIEWCLGESGYWLEVNKII